MLEAGKSYIVIYNENYEGRVELRQIEGEKYFNHNDIEFMIEYLLGNNNSYTIDVRYYSDYIHNGSIYFNIMVYHHTYKCDGMIFYIDHLIQEKTNASVRLVLGDCEDPPQIYITCYKDIEQIQTYLKQNKIKCVN